MANELRVRQNFISGTIDDNPLSAGATTLNATELAGLQAIDSTQHAALVLDPTGAGNGPEIVWVTAHTGSATSATIVRGREGTTGVSHTSTMTFVHVATRADYEMMGPTADRPSGTGLPYKYQRYFDTTLGAPLIYNGTNWIQTTPEAATVATSETITTGSSYIDIATSGPAITITTGTTALIRVTAASPTASFDRRISISPAVSGATTLAADDSRALRFSPEGDSNELWRVTAEIYFTGLTAGENTFTCKYKADGTSDPSVLNRTISGVALL